MEALLLLCRCARIDTALDELDNEAEVYSCQVFSDNDTELLERPARYKLSTIWTRVLSSFPEEFLESHGLALVLEFQSQESSMMTQSKMC
jgi:hypothetical protein